MESPKERIEPELKWALGSEPGLTFAAAVSRAVLEAARKQVPDLTDLFPFQRAWRCHTHVRDSVFVARLTDAPTDQLPYVGVLTDAEVASLGSLAELVEPDQQIDCLAAKGSSWLTASTFSFVGRFRDGKACWPDVARTLLAWLNKFVLPDVLARNRMRVSRAAYDASASVPAATDAPKEYDAFLCHASEDKKAIVVPFADLMTKEKMKPWLDAGQIGWGDSLVKKIEGGLVRSRFVIVFLSEAFLKKPWPERELQTALSMEIGGRKKVLPVVLGLDHEALRAAHPFVAEKRYVAIRPYDASVVVKPEELVSLLEKLKKELAKP